MRMELGAVQLKIGQRDKVSTLKTFGELLTRRRDFLKAIFVMFLLIHI